jgi:hypothetical protein
MLSKSVELIDVIGHIDTGGKALWVSGEALFFKSSHQIPRQKEIVNFMFIVFIIFVDSEIWDISFVEYTTRKSSLYVNQEEINKP